MKSSAGACHSKYSHSKYSAGGLLSHDTVMSEGGPRAAPSRRAAQRVRMCVALRGALVQCTVRWLLPLYLLWRLLPRVFEEGSYLGFTLARHARHDLGGRDLEKCHAELP